MPFTNIIKSYNYYQILFITVIIFLLQQALQHRWSTSQATTTAINNNSQIITTSMITEYNHTGTAKTVIKSDNIHKQQQFIKAINNTITLYHPKKNPWQIDAKFLTTTTSLQTINFTQQVRLNLDTVTNNELVTSDVLTVTKSPLSAIAQSTSTTAAVYTNTNQSLKITANKISYQSQDNLIIFTKEVTINQFDNIYQTDLATYNYNTGELAFIGNTKSSIVIPAEVR